MKRLENEEMEYVNALGKKFYYVQNNIIKEGLLKSVTIFPDFLMVQSEDEGNIEIFGFSPEELCANLLNYYYTVGFVPNFKRCRAYDPLDDDDIPF